MPNIQIEKFGNRIHIKPAGFLGPDLFATYLATVKSIGGVNFSKAKKCHTAPLDIEICRVLREKFGKSLIVGPELTAWAHAEVAKEKAILATMSFDMSQPHPMPTVEAIAPDMAAAMAARGYQTIVPTFGGLAGNFLNADQPGLGKTLETFASLLEMGIRGHILVIAPKTSLRATWSREVEKWLGEIGATAYVVGEAPTAAKRQLLIEQALADQSPLVFVLVNAEMVRLKEIHECNDPTCRGNAPEFCDATRKSTVYDSKFPILHEVVWDAIVGDEVHRYLMNANPRARSKSQVGLGFQRLKLADPSRGKIALSGTPMKGKPRLLWPTFHWLRPDLYTSQWRWSKHYFKTVEDGYAESGEKVTDDLRPEREEAFNRELSKMMIRRTKAELRRINPSWAPPEKRYAEVWLPMSPEQRRLYERMERDAAVMLEGGRLQADGILAEMTRLRQFANSSGIVGPEGMFHPTRPSNKVEWLLDSFLPERGIYGTGHTMEDGDDKVVIVSQFTSFLGVVSAALREKGIEHHVMTGKTNKPGEFDRIQQDWQTPGGPRVLLLNTMAGGVSITLDYADEMVIFDETWVPDDQEQVEDRVHRTSRTDHQVTIWYVRSEDSIERDLAGTNIIKDDRNRRSLDARRGIEVARRKWMK